MFNYISETVQAVHESLQGKDSFSAVRKSGA